MEEDLFPSGMSMNTRSELEEERRLFYVAITRAEKQAYLTYTQSRYRWGKLIDAEPSRFIEEIDEKYVEYLTPIHERRYKPMIDADIFGDVDKSKLRLKKPVSGSPSSFSSEAATRKLRKIKPNVASENETTSDALQLSVGNVVEHIRFGKGEVVSIEGVGTDKKAEIRFVNGGIKKLLLRFAKLNIIK
jgi:DNA helicase-2/ATP-dependent DNA helicase PcrA